METARDFLYNRLVTEPDGFHDHDSYQEQMSEGYEDQIIEAMESYAKQKLNIHSVVLSGWQACPKCFGQGTVSKPPYLAGDITHWSDSQGQHECNVCKGQKIINIATGLPPASH